MCLTLLLPSCASYRVEGKTNVPTLDGQRLYLKVSNQDAIVDLDSCEVLHGVFHMDGEVDSTTLGSLYLGGESLMPIVVDDEWLLDESNPNFYPNDFGTLNSVLLVD